MKIQTYNDIEVQVKWATPNPGSHVRFALDTTMRERPNPFSQIEEKTLVFLFNAEHTEPIEHTVICFYLKGISRSCLGQLARHRISSKTASSQHYQDYRDYPHIVSDEMLTKYLDLDIFFEEAQALYQKKLDQGIPREDARQVLPEAKAVNLMLTINASSLYNFFRKRMCNRNCEEIKILANKMWYKVHHWWPEYAAICGPPCFLGKCNQGYMACGKEYIHP